jgi:hypothetical protein
MTHDTATKRKYNTDNAAVLINDRHPSIQITGIARPLALWTPSEFKIRTVFNVIVTFGSFSTFTKRTTHTILHARMRHAQPPPPPQQPPRQRCDLPPPTTTTTTAAAHTGHTIARAAGAGEIARARKVNVGCSIANGDGQRPVDVRVLRDGEENCRTHTHTQGTRPKPNQKPNETTRHC